MNSKLKILSNYFWLFIVGSILGWVIEGIYSLIMYGKLINNTCVVIGPFNMIYGLGAVALTLFLKNSQNDSYIKLFLISFISGSLVEYIISFLSEKIMGFTAWDYSESFLNINGRVCLLMSFLWGILGIIWIKFLYPHIAKIISKMHTKKWNIGAIVLTIFLILDGILTMSAVNRAKNKEQGVEPANAYERFLDKTFNKKYLKNMYNDTWYNE